MNFFNISRVRLIALWIIVLIVTLVLKSWTIMSILYVLALIYTVGWIIYRNKNSSINKVRDFDKNSTGKKLLFIDDDKVLLDMYAKKFGDAGFNVATRCDVNDNEEKFVDMIARLNPDMLITDIIMPGRDGIQAIEILKNDNRTKGIPIAILSNTTNNETVEKAKGLGVLAYIVKAITAPPEIILTIKKLLNV